MKFLHCCLPLVLSLSLVACDQADSSHSATASPAQSVPPQPMTPATPVAKQAPSNWTYDTIPGNSFNKTRYTAVVPSKTTLNFQFPYEGAQNPQLVLRSDGVVLILFRGQVTCGIGDCPMLTKFDDGMIESVNISTPDDAATGVIYFSGDAPAFIKRLIVSKRLALNISFYQEGEREVDYDLSGLDLHKIDGWFELNKSDIPNALCLQAAREAGHEGFLVKQSFADGAYTFHYKIENGKSGTCTYSLKNKVPSFTAG